MILDAHCHLGPELPAPELLRVMDAGGVDRAVLIPAAEATLPPVPRAGAAFFCACMNVPPLRMPLYRAARRSGRLQTHARPDNAAVFDAAARSSGRLLPFAFVNPKQPDAIDELDALIAAGARGVKLHLWHHRFRLTDAAAVLRRAEHADIPVLAHLGFGPASDVEWALESFPKLRLVAAHAGIPHFERLWRLPRPSFDVAGAGLLVNERMVRRLLEAVGPRRVLFGSDGPVGLRSRSGDGHRYASLPALPDAALGATAASLLGE